MNYFAVKIQVDPYQCLLVLRPFVRLVPFIIPHTFREIYLSSVYHQRLDVFVQLIYARVGSCFALEYLRISRFDQRLKHRVTWIALICFVYLRASYSDFKGSLRIKTERVSTLPSNLRTRLRGIHFVQEVLIQGVSSLVPQNKGRRCGRCGRSYRCPPGSRVVQTTVVAVFQAAGVWHAGGVVDLKPVRVVGDPTAAELQQRPKQRVTFNSHPSLIKTVYLPRMKH